MTFGTQSAWGGTGFFSTSFPCVFPLAGPCSGIWPPKVRIYPLISCFFMYAGIYREEWEHISQTTFFEGSSSHNVSQPHMGGITRQ